MRGLGRHACVWLEQCVTLQTQLSDTTLFVEVLTRFCDDPRDLAQCRLAESKLRAELAQLQVCLGSFLMSTPRLRLMLIPTVHFKAH